MTDLILLYWVLPSLLTSLFIISYLRADDFLLRDFGADTWCHFILVIVLYPITLCALIQELVWTRLMKRIKR